MCAEVFCPTTHCCSAVVCYNIKPRGRPENAHRCVSKGMQKGYGKGKVKGKGGRRVGEKKVGNITGAACDMSLGVSNNEQHSIALKEFGFHIKVKLR